MLAIVPSATLHGLDGRYIRVEVDVAPGLPGFTIVGLADAALQEARERVRGALRNAGFVHPPRRITVNLAPADQRKAGASLDLAMAMGILLGSEQVVPGPGRLALIGELSLGGEVRSVPGVLPMVAVLSRRGLRRVVVAAAAVDEARLVDGIDVVGVETLLDAVAVVRTRRARRVASAAATDRVGRDGRDGRYRPGCCRCRLARPRHRSGPVRGARPGRGAARARDRAGRRSRPAAHRAARIGQDAPRSDDPRASAATRRCRSPGRDRGRVCSRRGSDRRAQTAPAVPIASSHHLVRRHGRRRTEHVARRDHSGGSGRPLPRRAARIRSRRPRGAPPTDGGGEGRGLARRAGDDLPGTVPARRSDEPVPLRVRGQFRSSLRLPAERPGSLSAACVRPVARPDRPVDLDAARRAARARARARTGGFGGRRGTDRRGTSHRARTPERNAQRAAERTCPARRLPSRPRQRSVASSSLPTWNAPVGGEPNACCASRERSRTSPGGPPSTSRISMRRPGSGRPTCGWLPPRSSEVLGVSATGPTGVAAKRGAESGAGDARARRRTATRGARHGRA